MVSFPTTTDDTTMQKAACLLAIHPPTHPPTHLPTHPPTHPPTDAAAQVSEHMNSETKAIGAGRCDTDVQILNVARLGKTKEEIALERLHRKRA